MVPNFSYLSSLEKLGMNLGLERIEMLLSKLGDPHLKFKSIHVAGTNGKGSTCAIIASILKAAGFKVGLYTSPHLLDYTERIKINGNNIPKKEFIRGLTLVKKLSTYQPTVFEVLTAVAFWYFAKKKIDYAVVEVGLGGRLDATNVIIPLVSVITNIELEHTEILGDTLEKIAAEKAAIIKKGVPVVTEEKKQGVLRIIREKAEEIGSELIREKRIENREWRNVALIGKYQQENAACAVAAIKAAGIRVTSNEIREGLRGVKWPGRFQVFSRRPLVIVDGAHNPAGIKALVSTLKGNFTNKFTIIFGCQKTKASDEMLRNLSKIANHLIITRSSHQQAADFPNSTGDLKEALAQWDHKSPLLITGSLFLVADALKARYYF